MTERGWRALSRPRWGLRLADKPEGRQGMYDVMEVNRRESGGRSLAMIHDCVAARDPDIICERIHSGQTRCL